MEYTTCRDDVLSLVKEANEKFGADYTPSELAMEQLDNVCDAMDEFIRSIDCECLDVYVDEAERTLVFSIICDEIVLQHIGGQDRPFLYLATISHRLTFTKKGKEAIKIELAFLGIWKRTAG